MRDINFKILLPITKESISTEVIKIASSLISTSHGRLIALGVVKVPPSLSYSYGALPAQRYRRLLREFARFGESENVEIRTLVKVSRNVWQEIMDTATERECDLLILGWDGKTTGQNRFFDLTIDDVVRECPKNLILVKPGHVGEYRNILLLLRGGVHAQLTFDIAVAIARRFKAHLTVMHVEGPETPKAESKRSERIFKNYIAKLGYQGEDIEILNLCPVDIENSIV